MIEINLFRNSRDKRTLETGEVLFVEGDHGEHMFAVIEGELELTLHGAHIESIGPGGVIGELALIDAVRILADALEITPEIVFRAVRPGDQVRTVAQTDRARTLLGWSPIIGPKQGLEQLAAWVEQRRID